MVRSELLHKESYRSKIDLIYIFVVKNTENVLSNVPKPYIMCLSALVTIVPVPDW